MKQFYLFTLLTIGLITYSCTDKRSDQIMEDTVNIEKRDSDDIRIGEVLSDQTFLLDDPEALRSVWNQNLSPQFEDYILISRIEVEEETDENGDPKGDFYLAGYHTVNGEIAQVSGQQLIIEGDVLYISGNKSCSCSGCHLIGEGSAKYCNVKWTEGGECYCTECPNGTCTKTVTETAPK